MPDDVIVLTAGFGTDVLTRIKVADLGSGCSPQYIAIHFSGCFEFRDAEKQVGRNEIIGRLMKPFVLLRRTEGHPNHNTVVT